MTSNETSWLFPPALNTTFREAFVVKYSQPNESAEDHGVYAILQEAVRNLTLEQRIDSRFEDRGWGGEDAVVQAGDSLYGKFTSDRLRGFGMNCILCTKGRVSGPIEQACSNYTDTENVVSYTKRFGPVSSPGLEEFPSLDQYSSIPEDTCGLCIFTIFGDENSLDLNDYSVPFSVLQKKRSQRRLFNSTYPTGVAMPPRPTPTWDPYNNPSSLSVPQTQEESSNNTGLIVGVVVGVLFVASCLMGLIIWLWTRSHRTKTILNPYSHSHHASQFRDHELQNVAIQRPRSVVRRPDSSASGEVPPPYHEAVRAKETTA